MQDLGFWQLFGIFGTFASILSLFISNNSRWAKWIHAAYSAFIVALVLGFNTYHESVKEQLSELNEIKRIEKQAYDILKTSQTIVSNGEKRGFILATLAFFEKNKDKYPDTYERAKQLSSNIELLDSKENDREEALHQTWKLDDVADAMKQLLKGITGGKI